MIFKSADRNILLSNREAHTIEQIERSENTQNIFREFVRNFIVQHSNTKH